MRTRLILPALLTVTALQAEPNYLINGDFDGVDGWSYEGELDGSHGIFSDPSREGRTWMLQLDGRGERASSEISQRQFLPPGRIWKLTADFLETNDEANSPERLVATINGRPVFGHPLGEGSGEWVTREAVFPIYQRDVEVRIALRGRNREREASTVRLDNVRLSSVDLDLPEPLWRGRPLAQVDHRGSIPFAAALSEGRGLPVSYAAIHAFREAFAGATPALAVQPGGWESTLTDVDAFQTEVGPNLKPLVEFGMIPILTPRTRRDKPEPILAGHHDAWFRAWAEGVRDWGYPILIRPWHEMDGTWFDYGMSDPEQFRAVWQHVVSIFRDVGADNVLWFWTPDAINEQSAVWYPGDDYVDIVGCSLYSRDGLDALGRYYREAEARYPRKAFAIAESAADDGRQGAWLNSVLTNALSEFPRIEFYTHNNVDRSVAEGRDYRIQSDPRGIAVLNGLLEEGKVLMDIPQAVPPRLEIDFELQGRQWLSVLTHPLPRQNFSSRYEISYWNGDPRSGGERIGRTRTITLDPGEKRRLRQRLPEDGDFYLRVDATSEAPLSGGAPDERLVQVVPVIRVAD